MFNRNFRLFIQFLNENQVRYLVVGSYAATLHGFPRRLKNLEIWVEASPGNARRMAAVIEKLGLVSLSLEESDFQLEDRIIQIDFSPKCRAILNTLNEIEFGACFEKRVQKKADEMTVDVIPLEHLRINKSNLWVVTGLGRR
ncbi:MAG: hypothetical protein GYA34_09735 [Chloroflexi bacterium]|nr:hypothetical protein [Chloroflexota bacterium]